MKKLNLALDNLSEAFPEGFTEAQKAKAQTLFLKRFSVDAHRFYGGKMQTLPKCGVFGWQWFGAWYSPGVSGISTAIRDNNDLSFELTSRGNMVGVVSDSTRVLGDGDCTLAVVFRLVLRASPRIGARHIRMLRDVLSEIAPRTLDGL